MTSIEKVAISTVKQNPRNARRHSKKQIQQIANSIVRFGWTYPILIDEHGVALAGNGRLQAADLLGLKEVPVIRMVGLNDAEKRALAIADNKIGCNAGWDRAMLAEQLGELSHLAPEFNLQIEITGFEAAEFDALVSDFSDSDLDLVDDIPTIENDAVSAPGEVWQLGSHKLMCGDARDVDRLRKLMGETCAAAAFLDPPYNLRIKQTVGRGRTKHPEFAMGSGELSRDQFIAFLKEVMRVAAIVSRDGAVHYVCMDWRHLVELIIAGRAVYGAMLNLAVWVKSNAGMGAYYRSQYEHVGVFRVGNTPHLNNVELGRYGRSRTNVWHYPSVGAFAGRKDDLRAHPTIKPVALVSDAIKDCTKHGDTIIDTFCGSGTSILAAERTGRRAVAVEIEGRYVDLAIRRWQAVTKRDAVLAATGETFDELAARSKREGRGR
jgi:DNA modification methylase